jgi:hypothetical protein
MPSKPIELPPEVVKAFVDDIRILFAMRNDTVKAGANRAQQLHALRQH